MLKSTQIVIHKALQKLGYPEEVYELLKEPLRMLTVKIPVRMDDGSTKIFTGYRAQHNDAVGPTKGEFVPSGCNGNRGKSSFDLDEFKMRDCGSSIWRR